MEAMEMRERGAVLWLETGKAPARSAQLMMSVIRDEYDTTRAAAIGMNPAGPRASDGDYSELAKRGEGLPRR
jgi:hypothetical protein